MKMRIQHRNQGNILLCALCTIVIVSLIGANVLVNCARHYNITAKQLKGWKEALYAAEAGGDAGFDEVRKALEPSILPAPFTTTDGWTAAGSNSWTKSFTGFDQAGNLSTIVTIDKLTDTGSPPTIPTSVPYYRIRAIGIAKLFGLPRVGLSDQFFAPGNRNFKANSASRGIGDTLLRKIDFHYDHFKATYGDGDGNFSGPSPTPLPYAQVTRRIELVAVPKFYVFGGAMRVTYAFDGPGSAGNIDSYSSLNKTNSHPTSPKVVNNDPPAAGESSYYGPNPTSANYPELTPAQLSAIVADAHDGDISVGSARFAQGGPIWGDVTTNGGNVTHSGYRISGTIDNNVPFTVPPLKAPDTTGYTTDNGGTLTASSNNKANPTGFIRSGITGNLTIKNGNAGTNYPFSYVRIVANGNVTGKITLEQGVTAQIFFTGNMDVKGDDLVNPNVDLGRKPNAYNPGSPGLPPLIPPTPPTPADDEDTSRVGHLQFYGISPAAGVTQTIDINSPGNIYATFYAPSADITLKGNVDVFSAIVGRSFSGNGNTGFHYDKALNEVDIGVVTDYQIASYVEDVR
jgi:hypothetical protein